MRVAPLALAALLSAPAAAQDRPPQGIGFAQADERVWLCRHEDPVEALACAREHCLEQAPGGACAPVAWCYPGGWSGVLAVDRGASSTARIVCGMPDEPSLHAMLAAFCLTEKDAQRCDLSLTVDPEGNERKADAVSFPGGAAAPPQDLAPEEAAPQDGSGDGAEAPADESGGEPPAPSEN